jgi:serine/threonine protein kinase
MNIDPCPSLEDLELFTENSSSSDISAHVSGCDACKESLAMIQTNHALLREFVAMDIQSIPSQSPPEIEGFIISNEIHRGGQGVVYLAEQLTTKRVVAVKVPIGGTTPSQKQHWRFEREVELAASLRHPGIVTVHEGGLCIDGRPYLAMEHVVGEPINLYFAHCSEDTRQRTAISKRIETFIRVCDAVSAAHQQGVLHRDLKPANILVDVNGMPRVLDFGIASAFGHNNAPSHEVTESGFVGTLAYAAPEQMSQHNTEIDTRADVYALGLTLYEVLTERRARLAREDIEASIEHFCTWIPDPPSIISAACNYEIDAIVLKALSIDPAHRYQSVADLSADLKLYLNGNPIGAMQGNTWYMTKKTVQRRALPIVLVSATVVSLVLISISMSYLYRRASRDAERARIETSESQAIRIFLEDTLASVTPRSPGQDTLVKDVLEEAVHWIGIALSDQPEAAASIHLTIGNSYRSLGLFLKAEEQILLAHGIHKDLFGINSLEYASSLNVLALLRADQEFFDESLDLFGVVLTTRKEILGERASAVATSHMNLARVQRAIGSHVEAEKSLYSCRDIRVELVGKIHADVAMCDYELAYTLLAQGNESEATRLHRLALQTRSSMLPDDHPDIIRSLTALGVLLADTGSSDEAIETLKRAWNKSQSGSASVNLLRLTIADRLYLIYESRNMQSDMNTWDSRAQRIRGAQKE